MVFFFSSRRRHTRFKCDWSSDVCSSDLRGVEQQAVPPLEAGAGVEVAAGGGVGGRQLGGDRKSVGEGKRGDLGGRRIIKKKKNVRGSGRCGVRGTTRRGLITCISGARLR